ncbi:signal peptidase I [Diplocloster agilis]|uniref:signal peptidase I n=1 Tax=Diplocloster agilis TaxID=2850323 RepID=UPI0008205630|nr:signal peptidase I [Suonthocola fibrivorans]MCU6736292.1 signal peptidase I [Suonthocola fibrivorans]SCJ88836.1 Signal peptidase I U [uncultured Clostridium sp.]
MSEDHREFPITSSQIEDEMKRENNKTQIKKTLRATIFTLIVVAAAAILVATLWMPVLRIYGTSMTPTLNEGDIVISVKNAQYHTGQLVSFYYGNKLLVKRIIAGPGDWVNIDEMGNVYVNDMETPLEEPYIPAEEKAYGEVTILLPYQVPEDRYFVLGDHRATSADSRNATIGCISEDQIVGRIVFCIWPLEGFGTVG